MHDDGGVCCIYDQVQARSLVLLLDGVPVCWSFELSSGGSDNKLCCGDQKYNYFVSYLFLHHNSCPRRQKPTPTDNSDRDRDGTGHHSTECWCFHFFHSTTTYILCGGLWGLTWQITFSRTEESKDVNGVSVIVALGNSCCWWPRGFTCVPQFQAIRRGDVGSFVAPGSHFPNTRHIPHQSSFICVCRQRCPSIYV